MSKTIEIKRVHIRNLFLSFIAGFGMLFCLEHFGTFSFTAPTPETFDEQDRLNTYSYLTPQTKVSTISYETFFKNRITTSGNNFEVMDLQYSGGDFYTYSNKIYYITEVLKLDIKYGFYFSLVLFLLSLLFSTFNLKFI